MATRNMERYIKNMLDGIVKNNYEHPHSAWLNTAIEYQRWDAAEVILDKLNIPKELSLKERISYYYLLGRK